MKNNLVKILGFSALALSLAACPGPRPKGAETIALDEAFAQTDGVFDKEGKLVVLEHLSVYSSFGNTLLAGYPLNHESSYYLKDVKSIEVELPELPKWANDGHPYGVYADVTVQGKLTNVNGRPVLKEASCEVHAEAKYDAVTGARIWEGKVSQYALPYYSEDNTSRSTFDQLTVENSGALMEGVFQLATVPSGVTNDAESTFKVVFPGENINGDDPTNEHAITVTIPKNVGTRGVNFINEFFDGKEKGDFFLLDAFTHFDSTKGGMGYLFDSAISPSYTDEVDNPPVIISEWSEIQDRYEGKYKGSVVPDLGTDLAFSYTLNDNFSGAIDDLLEEEELENWLLDQEKAGAFKAVANTGSGHAEEAFEEIKTKAAALEGWVLEEDLTDELADEYYYVLKEGEGENEKVIAEFFFCLENSGVSIMFAGIRATDAQVSTWAEAIQQYCAVVERDVPGFASQIPALPAATIEGVEVDWKIYEDVEGIGAFEFYPSFAADSFADNDAWTAYVESIEAALEEAGFVNGYCIPLLGVEGFYNATTKEFVGIQFLGNAQAYTGIVITAGAVLNATKAAAHLFDVSATSVWTVDLAKAYAVDGFTVTFGEGSFNVGSSYVQSKYIWPESYVNSLISALYSNAVPSCASSDLQIQQDGNDYFVDFYLPTETEGTYILVEIVLGYQDYNGEAYYNPYMVFGSVTGD